MTAANPNDTASGVRFFALGGLGEVGMNCLALEQDGQVMLIDCGVTFDGRGLGVDVVHPDFAALEPYRDRIAGVFLTHGHEDHLGALPYFLRRHEVPIYGPRYALELLRSRMGEHEILSYAHLHEVAVGERAEVGPFEIEPVRVTHSIADATALAIRTAAGTIIHSGDFKIDDDQPDGVRFDEDRLRAIGDEGVALLFSDSTNVDSEGTSGSERLVGDSLASVVEEATGAVIVGLFASNVHRLRMLGDIARRTRRRLVLFGRSVETHSRVARATGHLQWPSDLVFPSDRIGELPRNAILGVATGTQGEARAALSRMAFGDHPSFVAQKGDTFVLSSRIIPGNETEVFAFISELLRRGASVRSRITDRGIHVSGHAHRGEQRRMLELCRPRSFVPVHGTIHHLLRHAELARETGVSDVMVIENGQALVLGPSGLARGSSVPSGRIHTWASREVANDVIRERKVIADAGAGFVLVRLVGGPVKPAHVVASTTGVVAPPQEDALLRDVRREVAEAVNEALVSPGSDANTIAEAARVTMRRTIFRAVAKKPLVRAQLMDERAGARERLS